VEKPKPGKNRPAGGQVAATKDDAALRELAAAEKVNAKEVMQLVESGPNHRVAPRDVPLREIDLSSSELLVIASNPITGAWFI
jgi:hypothetical protein